MFCTNCGSRVFETLFCTQCGRPADASGHPSQPQNPASGSSANVTEPSTVFPAASGGHSRVPWIIGLSLGAIAVFLIGGVALTNISESDQPSHSSLPNDYGNDADLDLLVDQCDRGDYDSCDELYFEAPSDSEYQAFGDSCGDRNEPAGYCAEIYGEDSIYVESSDGEYGSDTYLDLLWDLCDLGDYEACDDLYFEAPSDSEYQAFGDSCGNRNEPAGYCAEIYG